jgi:hypothetical protein
MRSTPASCRGFSFGAADVEWLGFRVNTDRAMWGKVIREAKVRLD